MDLRQEIDDLLARVGPGSMLPTAYDTAWLARLSELDEPLGWSALEWIRAHQLPDGSWGAEQPYYHHDRAISTLAAVTALAHQGDLQDQARLQRAQGALERALEGLETDPAGETIGFEMIVPALLEEARSSGAVDHQGGHVVRHLAPKRWAKLAALPNGTINRFVTLGFSAEMAGSDHTDLLDVDNLQQADGSVSYSPSATAYFARHVRPEDRSGLRYLEHVAPQGCAPDVAPFDVFETAWVLWNLQFIALENRTKALCEPHLDLLEQVWEPGRGAGFAAGYAPTDGDETSIVFDVLSHFGRSPNVEPVLHHETPFYFRCFELESSPSVSTNIHALCALRKAGFAPNHRMVQKVLRFLREVRAGQPFWFDKWHTSPYYATAHAVVACLPYDAELADDALDWIVETQNPDGSWGYYEVPTAEETAYCLQAMILWDRRGSGRPLPRETLRSGVRWLAEHKNRLYPPLWIGKCLYCPELVVRSAILSSLALAAESQT